MKNYSVFILFFTLFNCSSEDFSYLDKFVVNDYTVTMDEHPTEHQLIGTIPCEVYSATNHARFIITSQNVANAIYLGESSIYVNDPILFDFETNPIIKANVKVERGYWYQYSWEIRETKTITVTIHLNDLPDSKNT
ncbi:MAG: hypothetical protein ACI9YE_003855 [Psychroserpens sp.]|jgi:hypothetical protein|tara:strand:+ start:144 stop:551 length:408 start_codon:yes stop_codon:yes gene_type:complete